ncbi:hypothetical protein AVEN_77204-1 [Araneus ventricosus]|uniref:Uncharacterized protein n=1 Tax=Araneus ventricosus TaxID=182803 RepID=A0A4Y2LL91_ARAVE|nr:hypothetical protein AVEN_77204-1 [Araneus ventricosus]
MAKLGMSRKGNSGPLRVVRSPLCSVFPQERTTYELPQAPRRKSSMLSRVIKSNPVYVTRGVEEIAPNWAVGRPPKVPTKESITF